MEIAIERRILECVKQKTKSDVSIPRSQRVNQTNVLLSKSESATGMLRNISVLMRNSQARGFGGTKPKIFA